jgi:hypothetical protein
MRRLNVMRNRHQRLWSSLALVVILVPSPAPAQTPATSFVELRKILKDGQTVIVTDTRGQRSKGKVYGVALSPPALEILAPKARTFLESSVAEIRATDGLRNGALLGASIGLGFAMWDYLIDPSEPGNAVIFTVAIGMGTAIGAGIDALIGGKVLYRPGQPRRSVTISPLATRARQGLFVSVRF